MTNAKPVAAPAAASIADHDNQQAPRIGPPRMTAMTLATARQRGAASSGGRFLRIPDVMKATGLGRSTIYRMVAAGTFPQQVKLSVQASGWWQADIDDWMRERLAACPLRS